MRKILFIISTPDGESIYNAMRLANVGMKKGDEISVFMLGKGVLFEQAGSATGVVVQLAVLISGVDALVAPVRDIYPQVARDGDH